jgi:peptidoglycan/LPS O-acetylase OafA/YrhL
MIVYNKRISFYTDSMKPGLYTAFFLFLMLINWPNILSNVFSKNYLLKLAGKYSFGIYLLHPMCLLTNRYIRPSAYNFVPIEKVFIIYCLSITCGYIFYYLIENPSMKVGNYVVKKLDSVQNSNQTDLSKLKQTIVEVPLIDKN